MVKSTKKKLASTPNQINAWEDDPGSGGKLVPVPVPTAPVEGLSFTIQDFPDPPVPGLYNQGTNECRYWVAYESMCRTLAFWRSILAEEAPLLRWQSGQFDLPARITSIVDLNAYYSRSAGLEFGHQNVKGGPIYTSDSPDIVAHEIGHAVLDALRPDLYDAVFDEINGFHEAFSDISSLLTTLQMQSFRRDVLRETDGNLQYNSRLSRLAEQVAAGIRQRRPDIVDADCMRNAANSFFYREPALLEPTGPAIILTSGRHSFSRVFTGAILEVLAGLTYSVARSRTPVESDLATAVTHTGRLLIRAVREAAYTTSFFHEVALRMIAADRALFNGQYRDDIVSAFVRRGILSVPEIWHLDAPEQPTKKKGISASRQASAASPLAPLKIPGEQMGFGPSIILVPIAPPAENRLGMRDSPMFQVSKADRKEWEESAKLFLLNLVRRGRIDVTGNASVGAGIRPPRFAEGRRTHFAEVFDKGILQIKRACFDF